VFMIVAVILAVAVRRGNDLLIRHAAVERERGNLARYFSPNVVEELSKNDEPLKQVRIPGNRTTFRLSSFALWA
jgi:adenylate cyclase